MDDDYRRICQGELIVCEFIHKMILVGLVYQDALETTIWEYIHNLFLEKSYSPRARAICLPKANFCQIYIRHLRPEFINDRLHRIHDVIVNTGGGTKPSAHRQPGVGKVHDHDFLRPQAAQNDVEK